MKKYFSKNAFISERGIKSYNDYPKTNGINWIDLCQGKEVINGYCYVDHDRRYEIKDEWCITTDKESEVQA